MVRKYGAVVNTCVRACVEKQHKKKKGEKRTKKNGERKKNTTENLDLTLFSQFSTNKLYALLFEKSFVFPNKNTCMKKTPSKKNNINRP